MESLYLTIWGAIAGYGVATALVIHQYTRHSTRHQAAVWWITALGWMSQLHGFASQIVANHGMLRVDLAASLELVAMMMGLLYLIGWRIRRQEVHSAGLVILPFILLSMLAARLLTPNQLFSSLVNHWLLSHILLSLMAYCLFSVAGVLALLDAFQEHALRTKRLGPLFSMLPAIGVLEHALFGMVGTGFALLTLSILSGGFYSLESSGVFFKLSHKVIFSWFTWAVFAALLIGHHYYGWRGKRVVRLTLFGLLFMGLAYFGVKFVKEVILVA